MPTRYTDCSIATMTQGSIEYGLIEDAALVVENGRVVWVGDAKALPLQYTDVETTSLDNRIVTPALIDCHTHLVFGGNRALEFELRSKGATYKEIAQAGGGIVSTVIATRDASDQELIDSALTRLDSLIAQGVAVVEIKSGYGLTINEEIRMLRLARKLGELRPVKIVTTWLAAHALPPDSKNDFDSYIDEVVIPGLEQAAAEGLVDAVDGFCETIAFTTAQIERVFKAAKSLDLPVKLHAEQLSDQKGALMAASYNALSADHLEYLSADDVPVFAKSETVAVMLPGAFYTLGETQLPPIALLRSNKVDMAVATDCNPGSSPIASILSVMNMACTQFAMTPEEALAGVTRCAAKALGLQNDYGTIQVGKKAELCVWNVSHPAELSYWMGLPLLSKRISQRVNESHRGNSHDYVT